MRNAGAMYYIWRWVAFFADLLDAIIGIITFTTVMTHWGLSIRCWSSKRMLLRQAGRQSQ